LFAFLFLTIKKATAEPAINTVRTANSDGNSGVVAGVGECDAPVEEVGVGVDDAEDCVTVNWVCVELPVD
jgi:hypothetical protein